MTIVLPSLAAPTAVLDSPPSQMTPATSNPPTGVGASPSGAPMPNAGLPVIQGNGLSGTTSPPVTTLLSTGQVPANANPTNVNYAAGLTSVLAQMSTGALSAAAVLTAAAPTQYQGN